MVDDCAWLMIVHICTELEGNRKECKAPLGLVMHGHAWSCIACQCRHRSGAARPQRADRSSSDAQEITLTKYVSAGADLQLKVRARHTRYWLGVSRDNQGSVIFPVKTIQAL